MGIRVDKEALLSQLEKAGCPERAELPFQKAILNEELPYTIGGGIGQSRICMFFLRKAHIGGNGTVLHLARGNPQRSGSPRNPAAVNNRMYALRAFYCHE